eukprot:CAMPEP_0176373208 /NCGR_PEP_ID=MMETSP0126-20121128/25889_1 /TAXON_ID=141414 ORGANISM="Strombidinopsis acuminatum, Strain SPMC142" /NCGR_SAMPLE_ID=MMETSP0126 /ASSEMBLY_ACC=CAM_ASM_000229 /LENGTH=82 /DNA_ID=CAMNT_0017733277 /DNA_START=11 /DNA_END=259 /DNA_ORIENTATION=-
MINTSSVSGKVFNSRKENTFMTPEPEFPVIMIVVLVLLGVIVFVTLFYCAITRGKRQAAEEARDAEKIRKKEEIEMRKQKAR